MRPDEVQCQEVVEVLTDYLEGELPPEERAALEQHLLTCEPCATYLQQLRTSITLTGRRLQEEDVPAQVFEAVVRMFEKR